MGRHVQGQLNKRRWGGRKRKKEAFLSLVSPIGINA